MDLVTLYRESVEGWAGSVAGIGADHWDLPTPCADWTVRDLVNHVVGEDLWAPPMMAAMTIEEVGDQFDGDVLGADPIATARAAADASITAATEALGAGGIVHLSFGDTPVEEYGWQLIADHLVHTWDLAAAIGSSRVLDPAAVDEVAGWFAQWEEMYRQAGAVGPRVALDGAGPQDNLIAGFGRDPGWSAG